MSYNNYVDADAACRAAYDHDDPCVAIIKHANPCGIAVGADVAEAHRKAHACDPVSAFGGVIAANRRGRRSRWPSRSPRSSPRWSSRPAYDDDALDVLTREEERPAAALPRPAGARGAETRPVSGGLLLQDVDAVDAAGDDPTTWQLACGDAADDGDARRPGVRLAGGAAR